jgi:hypothetical protein
MVNCPRCRYRNPDHAEVCGQCQGELFAFAGIAIPALLPAPMVEPIDTPQTLPPDSKLLPSRLARTVSLKEIEEYIPQRSKLESIEIDFRLPVVVDSPTMASNQSNCSVDETIHNTAKLADVAQVQPQDRIAPGADKLNHPGLSEYPMNDAATQSPAQATTPSTDMGDQSVTPVPPAAPPKLLVLRGVKIGMEYPIYEGRNTIGRFADKPVDIDLLSQESVEQIWCSRQHAAITFSKGIIFIEDLNSLNKTWVNGSCVHAGQQRQLKPGDIIQIGTVQMKLVVG